MQAAKPVIDFYEAGNICAVLEFETTLEDIVYPPKYRSGVLAGFKSWWIN
tara:strand:+ start:1336 stop:1485 length:150 start_codon:yes stop_codon:yes gene_type:complete